MNNNEELVELRAKLEQRDKEMQEMKERMQALEELNRNANGNGNGGLEALMTRIQRGSSQPGTAQGPHDALTPGPAAGNAAADITSMEELMAETRQGGMSAEPRRAASVAFLTPRQSETYSPSPERPTPSPGQRDTSNETSYALDHYRQPTVDPNLGLRAQPGRVPNPRLQVELARLGDENQTADTHELDRPFYSVVSSRHIHRQGDKGTTVEAVAAAAERRHIRLDPAHSSSGNALHMLGQVAAQHQLPRTELQFLVMRLLPVGRMVSGLLSAVQGKEGDDALVALEDFLADVTLSETGAAQARTMQRVLESCKYRSRTMDHHLTQLEAAIADAIHLHPARTLRAFDAQCHLAGAIIDGLPPACSTTTALKRALIWVRKNGNPLSAAEVLTTLKAERNVFPPAEGPYTPSAAPARQQAVTDRHHGAGSSRAHAAIAEPEEQNALALVVAAPSGGPADQGCPCPAGTRRHTPGPECRALCTLPECNGKRHSNDFCFRQNEAARRNFRAPRK